MESKTARELKAKAEAVAAHLSKPDRDGNHRKETFTVQEIRPLSESIAAVVFHKSLGKRAVAFFYYLKANSTWAGGWFYFIPTDSHLLGFYDFPKIKAEIERHNFPKNFGDEQ